MASISIGERGVLQRFWSHVDRSAGDQACWNWTGALTPNGYGAFRADGRTRRAHRYALALVRGVPPARHVLHSCDNPACVNPAHLREGTSAENAADKVERGRHPSGDRSATSILSSEDVERIRAEYRPRDRACGMRALGRRFGVSRSTIGHIVHGRTWKESNS